MWKGDQRYALKAEKRYAATDCGEEHFGQYQERTSRSQDKLFKTRDWHKTGYTRVD